VAGRLIVYSNPVEGREDEYNEWYDTVHLDEVLALGPFTAAQRFVATEHQMRPQQHRYVAIYEYEGTPEDAERALRAGMASMRLSDALADPFMVFVEPVGPRVVRA
jgi:hypothetical protein